MRAGLQLLAAIFIIMFALLVWHFRSTKHVAEPQSATVPTDPVKSNISARPDRAGTSSNSTSINVYAHNLRLRKGPSFRVYVRWLRGHMIPTRPNINPSFDDPESFVIDIKTGVLRANIGDISNFLNASRGANAPLKNIRVSGNEDQIKLTGTLQKLIPLPVELVGTMAAAPDNRIQIHVTKLSVLKIPFKAILGSFHVTISDLFGPQGIPGIQISKNDIFLETQKLLPPPHIRGQLTSVRIINPDLEAIYGNAKEAVSRVEQWRNFLRLREGTIDFGKLTMRNVDVIMVDLSNDAWFDLDLAHYQEQLVNGYTRMTAQAGLQIFMPDLDTIPRSKANQNISMEWLKNRNSPPPSDVIAK